MLGHTFLLLASTAYSLSLNLNDNSSFHEALSLIADGLLDYRDYSLGIGMMSQPYYWWHAGAAWNSILDFWVYTGNDSYNSLIFDALQAQVGNGWDYLPRNQSTTEGNDDQGFWGITAMAAAERNFTNPGDDKPGWLYLAQSVFNQMCGRWDEQHCEGGLRWQIYTWNTGYDYKNTVSNGCFFNIAARLARYTGNTTYSDWAEKIYDWLVEVDFYSPDNGTLWDGASLNQNCSQHSYGEWTYNYGLMMSGMAYLYDYTNGSSVWEDRVTSMWGRAKVFFDDKVMYEAACQPYGRCNNDQRCFRGIFSRFLGHTVMFVPSLQDEVLDYLTSSSAAAAQSCSGGNDGHTCGQDWTHDGWDGVYGLGEQMCALECIQNTKAHTISLPLTNRTGGTSTGSNDAGTRSGGSSENNLFTDTVKASSGAKAGAGVVTALCLVSLTGLGVWMLK